MNIIMSPTLNPETSAILQAFYSRSDESIQHRLQDLTENQQKVLESLQKYYIGYGHKSIGDCGTITIYLEDVSILAVKAIQHHPLYNGQESSTRYIDFNRPDRIYTPSELSPSAHSLMLKWLQLYNLIHTESSKHLFKTIKKPDSISETTYKNAILSAAFDKARGFLPTSVKTKASWTSTLSTTREHFMTLLYHPFEEVRQIAQTVLRQCIQMYPHSFKSTDADIKNEAVQAYWSEMFKTEQELPYQEFSSLIPSLASNKALITTSNLDSYKTKKAKTLVNGTLEARVEHYSLPRFLNLVGTITVRGWLDFGSYRDFLRHRNMTSLLPLLTPGHGLHSFYLDFDQYLSTDSELGVFQKYADCIHEFEQCVAQESQQAAQYLYPLGWYVPILTTAHLPQWAYVLELRTKQNVHPTLRLFCQNVYKQIQSVFKNSLDVDLKSSSIVNFKRGMETIITPTTE